MTSAPRPLEGGDCQYSASLATGTLPAPTSRRPLPIRIPATIGSLVCLFALSLVLYGCVPVCGNPINIRNRYLSRSVHPDHREEISNAAAKLTITSQICAHVTSIEHAPRSAPLVTALPIPSVRAPPSPCREVRWQLHVSSEVNCLHAT